MSSFNRDPEFMRAIIIDHYENPTCQIDLNDAKKLHNYHSYNSSTASCIDNITAFVFIKNKKIEDIKFGGIGCAICTSSTDLMSELLINKTIDQAIKIIDNYLAMINKEPYDEELLDTMYLYEKVNQQANRINCAKVGIEAIKQTILSYEKK